MALNRFRITAVSNEVSPGNISLTGEYFDNAAPGVVIATEIFTFSNGTSQAQAQAQVILRGQQLRQSIAQQANLQSLVGSAAKRPLVRKGVRLREWELRQQWKREDEEARQRTLKPRRRPKLADATMPAFASEPDILPSDQPWSPDDQTDADDLLMILALIET